jgi:hypothetical protein
VNTAVILLGVQSSTKKIGGGDVMADISLLKIFFIYFRGYNQHSAGRTFDILHLQSSNERKSRGRVVNTPSNLGFN